MKKIKILHMPVTNSGSGVTQYIMQNLKFIDRERFQFDFLTFSKKLDFEDEVISYGGKVHYLTSRAEENEVQFIKDMNRVFDEGYDVVHLHTSYWKSFLVEKIAIERKISKIIVHSHSTMIDIDDEEQRKKAIELHEEQKKLFSTDLATYFCACSDAAKDWLFGSQIPQNQIRILKNAIDTEEFSYNEDIRREYRKNLNIEDCYVLGHVGRFTYTKNHEILIEIFKEVCKKIENARLILVGDGPLMEIIKKRVKEYKIADKVLFLGRRTDVANIMQAMDIFLLPSRFEGLGLVLIEAQAVGLKCFASESVPEEAKLTSLLEYVPDNVDEWYKRVIACSEGYERKDTSKEVEEGGYGLKNQIKILEEIYAEDSRVND